MKSLNRRRKQKHRLIRKYLIDFWAKITLAKKKNKTTEYLAVYVKSLLKKKKKEKLKPYIYRIQQPVPLRVKRIKQSLAKRTYLTRRKLQMFYCNLKVKQFRRIANLAISEEDKVKKNIAGLIFSKLEHRLDVILFRCRLVDTLHEARQLILHRKILVNNLIRTKTNYQVNNFDRITLLNAKQFKLKIKKKLKRKRLLMIPPKYIMANYKLMQFMIISNPYVKSDVQYLFKTNDLTTELISGIAKYIV